MIFRVLAIILILASQVSFAQGRKPAVEDFVGIEVEEPEKAPQGTEVLFNFEKDISQFEDKKSNVTVNSSRAQESIDFKIIATFFIIAGLPVMIWLLMINRLRKKAGEDIASNIKVLNNYRQQKEEAKKIQDDVKKAS
jgi:hypothetical protein